MIEAVIYKVVQNIFYDSSRKKKIITIIYEQNIISENPYLKDKETIQSTSESDSSSLIPLTSSHNTHTHNIFSINLYKNI